MKLPYEVIGFIDRGINGSIFIVRYNSKNIALKINYGNKLKKNDLTQKSRKEFEYLTRLKDVEGIPNPILLLDYINGTYEELGLDSSGKTIKEVLYPNREKPYFSGAFLFELIKGRRLNRQNKQPKIFFDRLENIIKEIHKRGLSPSMDVTILEANNKPYLLDWASAFDFNDDYYKRHPYMKQNLIQKDIWKINSLKKLYMINLS